MKWLEDIEAQRKIAEILRILKESGKPSGARAVARELSKTGIHIGERAVRYYLELMDKEGLTKKHGYAGRTITKKGEEELQDALAYERVGFVISKIESLAYRTTYDLKNNTGEVVVNVSLVDKASIEKCLEIMQEVCSAGICVSPLVKICDEGEKLGGREVPKGKVGIATICSITIDGVLLKAGIPTIPKYGGIVEVLDREPIRFTDLIAYEGSSLDPLEVFMAKGMTSVMRTVKTGSGKILANFREIPTTAKERTEEILDQIHEGGFTAILGMSEPNTPILTVPVARGRIGVVVVGGVNPLAAVEEAGIPTQSSAMSTLLDVSKMKKL